MRKLLGVLLQTEQPRHHPREDQHQEQQLGQGQRGRGQGEPDQHGQRECGAQVEARAHRRVDPRELQLALASGCDYLLEVADVRPFRVVALGELQSAQEIGHGAVERTVGAGQRLAEGARTPHQRAGEGHQHSSRGKGHRGHRGGDQRRERELRQRQQRRHRQLQHEERPLADAVHVAGQHVLHVGLPAPEEIPPFRPRDGRVELPAEPVDESQAHPGQEDLPLPSHRRAHRGEDQEHHEHRRQRPFDAGGIRSVRHRFRDGASFAGRRGEAGQVQEGDDHEEPERLGHPGSQEEQQRQNTLARRVGNQLARELPGAGEGAGRSARPIMDRGRWSGVAARRIGKAARWSRRRGAGLVPLAPIVHPGRDPTPSNGGSATYVSTSPPPITHSPPTVSQAWKSRPVPSALRRAPRIRRLSTPRRRSIHCRAMACGRQTAGKGHAAGDRSHDVRHPSGKSPLRRTRQESAGGLRFSGTARGESGVRVRRLLRRDQPAPPVAHGHVLDEQPRQQQEQRSFQRHRLGRHGRPDERANGLHGSTGAGVVPRLRGEGGAFRPPSLLVSQSSGRSGKYR